MVVCGEVKQLYEELECASKLASFLSLLFFHFRRSLKFAKETDSIIWVFVMGLSYGIFYNLRQIIQWIFLAQIPGPTHS